MKNIYADYADVSRKIEVLEADKEFLRVRIAEDLPDDGIKNEFVTASWTRKKKWTYSPRVTGLKAELDATREMEETNGTATAEEIKQLTIKIK